MPDHEYPTEPSATEPWINADGVIQIPAAVADAAFLLEGARLTGSTSPAEFDDLVGRLASSKAKRDAADEGDAEPPEPPP